MRPAEGAHVHGSFRERLLLPSPLQWAVRVVMVVIAGIVIFAMLQNYNDWAVDYAPKATPTGPSPSPGA